MNRGAHAENARSIGVEDGHNRSPHQGSDSQIEQFQRYTREVSLAVPRPSRTGNYLSPSKPGEPED